MNRDTPFKSAFVIIAMFLAMTPLVEIFIRQRPLGWSTFDSVWPGILGILGVAVFFKLSKKSGKA